jgi:hypothetical protein
LTPDLSRKILYPTNNKEIVMSDVLTWRRVPDFPTNWVSSNGHVLSLHPRFKEGRILKFNDSVGYKTVVLVHNKVQKKVKVHRLVCELFHPKLTGKNDVNHKDCDKYNNHLDNLEWCSKSENIKHAWKNGRIAGRWGKR